MVKNPPAKAGDMGSIPGWGDPLEKEAAVHSRIPAWRIPRTEEPGGGPWDRKESDTQLSDLTATTLHFVPKFSNAH